VVVLALSSWTWLVVAAFGLLTLGILIRATLMLIAHVKGLTRALSSTSGELQGALDEMREGLDRAAEELAEMRRRREPDAHRRPGSARHGTSGKVLSKGPRRQMGSMVDSPLPIGDHPPGR